MTTLSSEELQASFRINFSTPTEEQIQKGIAILGETAKQM